MSSFTKLFKLGLAHRKDIQSAYAKNGTDFRAHRADAMDIACDTGTKAATAPLRAAENIPRLVVRGLQFLFALIMVGIYGVRVGDGQKDASESSSAWYFGLVVGVMACISALILAFTAPFGAISKKFKTHHLFGWDLLLSLLWFIAFGVFMGIFHHRSSDDPFKGSNTTVQKSVTWIDLLNALFWLISGVYGFVKTWMGRKRDAALLHGRGMVEGHTDRLFSRGGAREAEQHNEKEDMYEYSSVSDRVSEPERVYYQGRPSHYAGYQV